MANSCSFYTGGNLYTDAVCFAKLYPRFEMGDYILIENRKKFYSDEKISEYLNDLNEMGFESRFEITKKGVVKIYPEFPMRIRNKRDTYYIITAKARMFTMAVRYLWEGKYKNTTSDMMYLFFEEYMKLKKRNLDASLLELLCLAHNVALLRLAVADDRYSLRFNSNHMWCFTRSGCEILKELPDESISNANDHCSNRNKLLLEYSKKGWKLFTDKRLNELLKL